MKKYLLFITIGSLFLGIQSHAMQNPNINTSVQEFKRVLETKLMDQEKYIYFTDRTFPLNKEELEDRCQMHFRDEARYLKLDQQTATRLTTDALIEGIKHAKGFKKSALTPRVIKRIQEIAEDIFRNLY